MDLIRVSPGSEESALALLVADLIRQNVQRSPAKAAQLKALALAATIVATDLEAEVTLVFDRERGVEVHARRPREPHVTIIADSGSILDLARLSIHRLTGLPVLWDRLGRTIVRRMLRKQVRIVPMGRHLGKLTRLMAILSVSS